MVFLAGWGRWGRGSKGDELAVEPGLDQFADAGAVVAGGNLIDVLFEFGQGVGDGGGEAAEGQEGLVVFGVADADGLLGSEAEVSDGGGQSGGLVDAARQDHDGVLVEDDLEGELKFVDEGGGGGLVGDPGGDDDAALDDAVDAAGAEQAGEVGGGGIGQEALGAGGGVVEQGAVFGDDAVEEVEAGADDVEFVEDASGDEDEGSSGLAEAFEGGQGWLVDSAMVGDGAVVVGGQGQVVHGVIRGVGVFGGKELGELSNGGSRRESDGRLAAAWWCGPPEGYCAAERSARARDDGARGRGRADVRGLGAAC